MTERRKTLSLRDIPAEWMLGLVILLLSTIIGMGGYFGDRVLNKIEDIQKTLTSFAGDHIRINRNEADIQELKTGQDKLNGRVISLEKGYGKN